MMNVMSSKPFNSMVSKNEYYPDPRARLLAGELVLFTREEHEWTQDELSARMGITVPELHRIENSETPITEDFALLLAQAFDTSKQFC